MAASMKRSEKSKTLHRPIMPLSQTHQLSVERLPSKYSPTPNLVAIALLRSHRPTNSTERPFTSSTR